MVEVFAAKEALLRKLGWSENPFVKDLRFSDRESFLKFYYPLDSQQILRRLAFDAKAILLLGPKGVGKTSAMQHAFVSLPEKEFTTYLLKEPPENLDALSKELGFSESIFERFVSLFGKKKPQHALLVEFLRSKGRLVVVFVDEAHLLGNRKMFMEFKYLLDDVSGLRFVFSALGSESFPDSLLQLVGSPNILSRKGFSSEEMLEIIKHRIRAVGGKTGEGLEGAKPFSKEFLERIFTEQNLLSPRYVFDELNSELARIALEDATNANQQEVTAEVETETQETLAPVLVSQTVSQAMPEAFRSTEITTSNASWWDLLSPSQQAIVSFLLRQGAAPLSDIAKASGLPETTTFNALYQLRGEDKAELARKPQVPFPVVQVDQKLVGRRRKNVYFLSEKIKPLFTLH